MKLKEAIDYKYFLDRSAIAINNLITRDKFALSIVGSESPDKAINRIDLDTITEFLKYIARQKRILSEKISECKRTNNLYNGFDVDGLIDENKSLRNMISTLGTIYRKPQYTDFRMGDSEKENIRSNVKEKIREISKTVKENSYLIDKYMINAEIEYTPIFDEYDDIEDQLDIFVGATFLRPFGVSNS